MSLEKQIETLNTNIEKLISIFEAYPNPIDEASEESGTPVSRAKAKSDEKKASAKAEAPEKTEPAEEVAEPEHSIDDLAALAKKVVQADKATNQPQIKKKLDSLGIKKVTLTPPEHIDEMYSFLEGLE